MLEKFSFLRWRYSPDLFAGRYPADRLTDHVEIDRKAGGPAQSWGRPGTTGTSFEIPEGKKESRIQLLSNYRPGSGSTFPFWFFISEVKIFFILAVHEFIIIKLFLCSISACCELLPALFSSEYPRQESRKLTALLVPPSYLYVLIYISY